MRHAVLQGRASLLQSCDVIGDVTDTLLGRLGRQRHRQAHQALQGLLIGRGRRTRDYLLEEELALS